MSSKSELRARKDKAALIQSGRLMERRFDREQQEYQAEIAELQAKLEEAQREATMAKGGGGAMKELQKELADLRLSLAEAEAALVASQGERDAATKERDDVLTGRPGASQAVLRKETERAKELESQIKQLQDKLAQAEKRALEASTGTGSNNEQVAALEKKMQETERRCADMQKDAVKAVEGLADLKVKLVELEELKTRETQRRTRQLKHAEERAERMREELITVWEASNRQHFSEAGKNKFVNKALDLEKDLQAAQKRIVQLEDKGLEGKVVATERIAKRFFELLEFFRISEDDAAKLVKDGVSWPAAGAGPQNLKELMQEPKPAPPPLSAKEQNQVKKLEATIRSHEGKITELEKAVKSKSDEIITLEADRQRLEDEVAKQKSKMLLAERDAQERNDELIQVKGRKDKEATDSRRSATRPRRAWRASSNARTAPRRSTRRR
ncbi:hypothetical protein DMC30DRAFT_263635 [Rhodotorula diobovata]|uniref:Uncharacterized protein n=1 Tax=Rhodotorula diobovata TaxID=5288 RepID=A0A5C5FTQ8_9BASI|nr:hypothetical protein DMC30DRAFT_263635 [Rhodotorula diobovata]